MSDAEQRIMRRQAWAILGVSLLLVVGLGGWAATTEFAGAVIAPGQLVVESNLKKVQHPTGGIVGELRVKEGDKVRAGDVLLRLDETQTRAGYSIVLRALDELAARQARAEAERDGAADLTFPAELLARSADPDVRKLIDGERRQFEIRGVARDGAKSQLRERIAQLNEEVVGYGAQIVSKDNQIAWIAKELIGVEELWTTNLVPYMRVTSLQREKERLSGERGQLIAGIAQSKGRIAEINLQILQVDQDMRAEVGRDLADIRAKSTELRERKIAAEDQLRRIDILAPSDGIVHQLTVHTVGGVITAGEQVMLIVPQSEALVVEVRVPPQDIDQLWMGQPAVLRFVSFNQRTTPELNGEIIRISADVSEEPRLGLRYYTVRIGVPPSETSRLGERRLVPGMPVESFIQTIPRTVLSFLTKPLIDQASRAFREK